MYHPNLTRYLGSANENPVILGAIANEDWTLNMATAVARHNPYNVRLHLRQTIMNYVPVRFHTRYVWLTAVCSVTSLIAVLPKEFRVRQFYEEAVRKSPSLFRHVPVYCRSPQLSLDIFGEHDAAIGGTWLDEISGYGTKFLIHVPPESQSDELVTYALSQSTNNIKYITCPTLQQQIAAIDNDPSAIDYFEPQTLDLCLYAVNVAGILGSPETFIMNGVLTAIRHQTDEICLLAVKKCPLAMKFVRDQREELCFAAFDQVVQTTDAVPLLRTIRNQTFKICMAAYDVSRSTFFKIRNRVMRDHVARSVLSRAIVALRDACLSTLLLTEVCEAATPALFPAPAWRERNVLTLSQIWQLARLVREWA